MSDFKGLAVHMTLLAEQWAITMHMALKAMITALEAQPKPWHEQDPDEDGWLARPLYERSES